MIVTPMDLFAAKAATRLFMMALTAWREARGQGADSMLAVCFTVTHRAEHPRWWGTDVESVVEKKWQYSSIAAPGDPQLVIWPRSSDPSWLLALGCANAVLLGAAADAIPGSDSYYDDSLAGPPSAWGSSPEFLSKIGTLNFYKVDRDWEAPTTGHDVA